MLYYPSHLNKLFMLSKKLLFTLVLVFATIFSFIFSSPILAVSQNTSCPTLKSGDMVKVVGKPAIYVLDDSLHYQYFPDGDVFKSWNNDESYSKYYVAISQKCFDNLQAVPNTPFHTFYRAGSHLVKYLSSDNLFVVGLDNKLYPILTTAAKTIFGNNYTFKNIGLSEWPNYTKESTTITKAEIYPGMLFKTNNKTYFVDEEKVLHEVTATGMIANHFKTSFVRNLPTSVLENQKIGETINSQIPSLITKNEGNTGEYLSTEFSYLSVSVKTTKPQPMSFFTHILSVSGEVKNPENQKIIEQGIIWDYATSLQINTQVIPTVEKNAQKVIADLGQNNFSVNIFGLPPSAYPFIRAYAIVEDNTVVYGKVEPINQSTSGSVIYGTPALPTGSGGSIQKYNLTYLAGTNGTLTGFTTQVVEKNENGSAVIANPDIGYNFINWSDGSIANPRTDTNVTADIVVTANFTINTYTLNYIAESNGSIAGVSPQTINHGSNGSTVTATPNTRYHFVIWSDGVTTTQRTDTNITSNLTATATFAINTYAVTFENWDSTVLKTETVNHGAGATAPANPTRIGHTFTGWDVPFNNITSDLTVTAEYSINTFTVNYNTTTGGSISGNTSQTVDYNSSTTQVVAIPDSGYTFINWNDSFASSTRTDLNITDNATYTARFGFINISSPTNSEEIVIDTEFTVTGTSQNIDQIIIEASTNTIDWVTLNSTSTLSNTFSATSTLSSSNFSAGVSTTIRVKSAIYNHVYDSVEVMVGSGIEYPYAMRDNSNVMRYSKTLDLSAEIITGFTMSASVNIGEFVYDGEYTYSLIITSATSVTITKHNMLTGATVTSYNFNPNVDISKKLEFYSRNNKIYLFWQDGTNVKFKILSRALAVLTDGTLEAKTGVTITLNQIGRGIIDVGSNGIFAAVSVGMYNPMGYTAGMMAYNMYSFDGSYVKGVRETAISNSSQYDYVNVMCFQDGKVGLYESGRQYIYDASGNDLNSSFSFNSVIIIPTNTMYRYSFVYSRASVNAVQEFGSTGLLGSMTDYAHARKGFVKAF